MNELNQLITVSIATKDRPEVVNTTLQKIHEFGLGDCPLILFDDGSSEVLNPPALSLFREGRVIRNETAQGQALGRNRIVAECKTPYLLQLDDDSYPVSGDVEELIELAIGRDDWLALAVSFDEPARGRKSKVKPKGGSPDELSSFVGCSVLIAVERFLKVGGYAEWIGRTVEEEELCMRGHLQDLKILWTDAIKIRHDVTPVARMPEGIIFRSFRNWTISWCLHAPVLALPWRLGRLCAAAGLHSVKGKRTLEFGAFCQGLKDAVRGGKPVERFTWEQYRRFRKLPHALSYFE